MSNLVPRTGNPRGPATLVSARAVAGSVPVAPPGYEPEVEVPMVRLIHSRTSLPEYLQSALGHDSRVENGMIICDGLGIIFKFKDPNIAEFPKLEKRYRIIDVPNNIEYTELQRLINSILVFNINPKAGLPERKYDSVGFDLYCAVDTTIEPGEMTEISTGVYFSFPKHVWGLLVGRSSLFRQKITTNTAIIDPGYQGELFIACYNWGKNSYEVQIGDRMTQLIPMQDVPFVGLKEVESRDYFPTTQRGEQGFGSTGK